MGVDSRRLCSPQQTRLSNFLVTQSLAWLTVTTLAAIVALLDHRQVASLYN